jgi:hypothetical protein
MKKIHVIRNKDGKAIATFEKAAGAGPSVEPVLEAGHTIHEMEVADNYHEDIKTFYTQHG